MENLTLNCSCGEKYRKYFSAPFSETIVDSKGSLKLFKYFSCKKCGLIELLNPYSINMDKAYPSSYGPYNQKLNNKSHSIFERMGHKLLSYRFSDPNALIDNIVRSNIKYKSILDYGCGAGHYLDRYKQNGFATTGLDFKEQVLAEVSQKGHQILYPDDLKIISEKFSVISLNHVIEHLLDPELVLDELLKHLDAGGVMIITTVNPLGISSKIFKLYWFGLYGVRHLKLFPSDKLADFFSGRGFNVRVIPRVVTKDFSRSFLRLVDKFLFHIPLRSSGDLNPSFASLVVSLILIFLPARYSDQYSVVVSKDFL